MSGIVEIIIDTPCYECHRLARYTVYHRANDDLLERLRKPISHRDVHDISAMLESQQEQVAAGVCECGAAGQETTSVEFRDKSSRDDLHYVAPDLSFEIVRLSLDGQTLWESDLEIWRKGLGDIQQTPEPAHEAGALSEQRIDPGLAPDPTPDELIEKSKRRQREWARVRGELDAWITAHADTEESPK